MPNKLHRFAVAFTLVVTFATPGFAQSARINEALGQLAAAVSAAHGELGVAVVSIDDGRTIAGHQPTLPLNPASNMKVLTAWAALRKLGPQHRYLTGLYGTIENTRVPELVLRGDGDPSLEMRHLWEMAAELQRAGVREVGDILVDQSHFDARHVPPAFEQQPDEWAAFRAPVAAVSLAANTLLVEVRSRRPGDAASVSVLPVSFVEVSGSVRTTERGTPEAVKIDIRPSGDKLAVRLSGTVPVDSGIVRIWRRVDDPSLLAGYALRDVCASLGIAVAGDVKAGGKGKRRLLSAHRSAPLSELLSAVGKHSNNFYAEMVFKSMSADGKQPASFARSSHILQKLLRDSGIDPAPFRFENGSGLFDANRVSAEAIAQLLARAFHDPRVAPELTAQLAIGGVDGTLRHRFREHAKTRAIRAKTGTLASVSSLSGYLLDKRLAFSVMVNGARDKSVAIRKAIDRFVARLTEP